MQFHELQAKKKKMPINIVMYLLENIKYMSQNTYLKKHIGFIVAFCDPLYNKTER